MSSESRDIDADVLISRYLDGGLDDAQAAALNEWVKASAANARRLAEAAYLHRRAYDELRGAAATDTAARPAKPTPIAKPIVAGRIGPRRLAPLAIAAAVLIGGTAIAVYFASSTAGPQTPTGDRGSAVATVLDTTDGATLVINDRIASPGDEVPSGDILLDAGSADFRFDNGVGVTLRGSTQLTVHDPMHATLSRGSASFTCPNTAKGYTVHLPSGAKVVDLGTRFSVNIAADGTSEVRVLEGSVTVHEATGAVARPLTTNRIANFAADGTLRSVMSDYVYVNAVAGDGGNTVNAADGSGMTWSNDNANRGASRINTDHLWGTPPLSHGYAATPHRMVWESADGEDSPAITTTIRGLDQGVYEVCLLWVCDAQQSWAIRAKLATDAEFMNLPSDGVGEQVEVAAGVKLLRFPLGRITGDSISVDVDDVPGAGRSRYVGIAYRRIDFLGAADAADSTDSNRHR